MSGSKILFVGCSLTYGQGLGEEINDPKLWCNQVAKELFPNHQVDNRSRKGANNDWIFLETMSALMKEEYDTVFVEWTAIPRYNIDVGLELYDTRTLLADNSINVNTNWGTFKASWLKDLGNGLRMLHHDHWDILKIVKYVNVLKSMHHGNIYFVNGMLPWPRDYFVKKEVSLPSDLSQYEQDLLNVDNRNDEEIFELYDMIHLQYKEYGGILPDNWLNLYDSLISMQIDIVSEQDKHPGYDSQNVFVEMIKNGISS